MRKRNNILFHIIFALRTSKNYQQSNGAHDKRRHYYSSCQRHIMLSQNIRKLGLGILYPSFDEIAKSIAKRDKTRIIPAGAYALNLLGLSTQVPMNVVYLTDGERRKITIHDGHSIFFKHVAPRIFAFSNSLAQLITIALKEIGNGNVTEDQKQKIKQLINSQLHFSNADMRLMPNWIRQLITDLYD